MDRIKISPDAKLNYFLSQLESAINKSEENKTDIIMVEIKSAKSVKTTIEYLLEENKRLREALIEISQIDIHAQSVYAVDIAQQALREDDKDGVG